MTLPLWLNRFYIWLIWQPVQQMYMIPLADRLNGLTDSEKQRVFEQGVLLWIEYAVLLIGVSAIFFLLEINASLNQNQWNPLIAPAAFLILEIVLIEIQCIHGFIHRTMLMPRLPRRWRIARGRWAQRLAVIYGVVMLAVLLGGLMIIHNALIRL